MAEDEERVTQKAIKMTKHNPGLSGAHPSAELSRVRIRKCARLPPRFSLYEHIHFLCAAFLVSIYMHVCWLGECGTAVKSIWWARKRGEDHIESGNGGGKRKRKSRLLRLRIPFLLRSLLHQAGSMIDDSASISKTLREIEQVE